MWDPQVTMGFNTKSQSNDLDDLEVPPMPHLRTGVSQRLVVAAIDVHIQ